MTSLPLPFLTLSDITKTYHGNTVLKNFSLSIKRGEIHGIIGENGAGKSTLMNILFGMPIIFETGGFTGSLSINGDPVQINSPETAMKLGIGMVHQEFMLIPELTVYENIKLNRENLKHEKILGPKLALLDHETMKSDSTKAIRLSGIELDAMHIIEGLPLGHMQFIEIARELDKTGTKLLVFDEPTAVLTESESEILLKTMMHLAHNNNFSILFISHRLQEIMDVCDNITVLRDGEKIATLPKHEASLDSLAEMMVSRKIEKIQKRNIRRDNKVILELNNFHVEMQGEAVCGINLSVYEGEILGIAGLAGQGKLGIANGISGLSPCQGEILVKSTPLPLNNPLATLNHKIAFLSEDRKLVGLLLDESISDNIALPAIQIYGRFLNTLSLIDRRQVREHAKRMITKLDIRCTNEDQHTRRLSGGNQQKVCIAKILTLDPEILLVSEPTRGVDIGAKKIILDKLLELNESKRMTIILTSSELAELRSIADRIVIMNHGKIAKILTPDASDAEFGKAFAC